MDRFCGSRRPIPKLSKCAPKPFRLFTCESPQIHPSKSLSLFCGYPTPFFTRQQRLTNKTLTAQNPRILSPIRTKNEAQRERRDRSNGNGQISRKVAMGN
ncbi:hypothetical protein niasHT_025483 [Heterodera trifolii]|uniref:Uncharacterized protein n=1 Tax=Heterodera trifolii TaxID=157864 RepID=A0ABD2KT34_9BILA